MSRKQRTRRPAAGYNDSIDLLKSIRGLTLALDYRFGVYTDTALTTPATIGQTVKGWRDRSNNGYHATEATNPPLLANDGLTFDGTNDKLSFTPFVFTTCTVFVAGQTVDATNNNRWLSFSDGVNNDFDNVDSVAYAAGQLVKLNTDLNITPAKSAALNIMTFYFGGGNAAMLRNGVSIGTDTYTNQTQVDPTQAYIGAGVSSGNPAFFIAATIKAVLFYNRTLSATELTTVHRYLGSKYAITVP